MSVTFTSLEYDPDGVLEISPDLDSNDTTLVRRIGSVATLDGGRDFEDRGFTDSDREMVFTQTGASLATTERAARFIRLYAVVRMFMDQGVFLVTIQQVDYSNGGLNMRVLIRSKEA